MTHTHLLIAGMLGALLILALPAYLEWRRSKRTDALLRRGFRKAHKLGWIRK